MKQSRAFPLVVVCLMGCSDAAVPGNDAVAALQQELSAVCASAAPTAVFANAISFTSERTYSAPGCFKAQVVDTESFVSNPFGGSPSQSPSAGSGGGTSLAIARWADSAPTDATSCAQAWVAGYRFEWDGSAYVAADFQSGFGTWQVFRCLPPTVMFSNVPNGTPQRFAVTARTQATATASTRRVSLH